MAPERGAWVVVGGGEPSSLLVELMRGSMDERRLSRDDEDSDLIAILLLGAVECLVQWLRTTAQTAEDD